MATTGSLSVGGTLICPSSQCNTTSVICQ